MNHASDMFAAAQLKHFQRMWSHMRVLLLTCVLAIVLPLSVCAVELPNAPKDSFSIVVIPDTQHYRGRRPSRTARYKSAIRRFARTWTGSSRTLNGNESSSSAMLAISLI